MTGFLESSELPGVVPDSDLKALERLEWPIATFEAWREQEREKGCITAQKRAQIEAAQEREVEDGLAWEIYERERAQNRLRNRPEPSTL